MEPEFIELVVRKTRTRQKSDKMPKKNRRRVLK